MAKVKPVFDSSYTLISTEEPHIGLIEDWDFRAPKPGDEGGVKEGRVYQMQMRVQGGENDGAPIWDFFYTTTKNDFSMARLAGMLIKSGALPESTDIDTDNFKGQKNEEKIKRLTQGKRIGFVVKHEEYKSKTRNRIVRYLSTQEVSGGSSNKAVEKVSGDWD